MYITLDRNSNESYLLSSILYIFNFVFGFFGGKGLIHLGHYKSEFLRHKFDFYCGNRNLVNDNPQSSQEPLGSNFRGIESSSYCELFTKMIGRENCFQFE